MIDTRRLRQAMLDGLHMVKKHEADLNTLNVFPVADADTGTNLMLTLRHMIQELPPEDEPDLFMKRLSKNALLGARGNSGLIFACFIQGITEQSTHLGYDLFHRSIPYAYRSVENPMEGTILTVMKKWADYMAESPILSVRERFLASIEIAKIALAETTEQLDILKRARRVDAGAKGFVIFLEGCIHSYFGDHIPDDMEYVALPAEDHENRLTERPRYRYCTEAAVLKTLPLQPPQMDALRKRLQSLGDSLILADTDALLKIHLHTDHPNQLMQQLRPLGTLCSQKADDMLRQFEMSHDQHASIALVTDSMSDVPEGFVDQYQIHVIPLQFLFEDSAYLDGLTIRPGDIALEKAAAKTSQPGPFQIAGLFEQLLVHYDSIIAITLSKELSGTHQSFLQAKSMTHSEKPIDVINSRQNSAGIAMVVMKAAEDIASGKSHHEVLQGIEDSIQKSKILVSLVSLDALIRSGRVKKPLGGIMKFLRFKPILSVDSQGAGILEYKTFGLQQNTKAILDRVRHDHERYRILRFGTVYSQDLERCLKLEKQITAITGLAPLYRKEITPALAVSAGVGSIAVGYLMEKKGE